MEDTEEIENLKPQSAMNDRNNGARAAARGKLDAASDVSATCGEHALCNSLGAGDDAADKLVNDWRGVTKEQTALDEHKVKAMHNAVGWFTSPANALVYKVSCMLQ